jgi:hypothetical protein
MRLKLVLGFTIPLILFSAESSARDWNEVVDRVCNEGNASESACFAACKKVEAAGALETLPMVSINNCKNILGNRESKPLRDKACGTSTCIVRLESKNSGNARRGTSRYAGNGFVVEILEKSSEVPGSSDTLFYATIHSSRGVTSIIKDCAGDGSCDDWQYKSGPLKNATITTLNKGIILQFPR